jgi:hypothetical protein
LCTYRIPNLKLYLVLIYVDQTCAEFHSDREVVDGLKSLVSELQQQAAVFKRKV